MKKWILGLGIFLASSVLHGYDIIGIKWPQPTTRIYTGISGVSPSGVAWSTALQEAAQRWNDTTIFEFDVNSGYRDPCSGLQGSAFNDPSGDGDGNNGMAFTSSICGSSFNASTLAVTLYFYEYNGFNQDLVEADIFFKNSVDFDVYDTRPNSTPSTTFDFRRVALHELGHAIGLRHESDASSIMQPIIGSIFTPKQDDIDGISALYSGHTSCTYPSIDFGLIEDSLSAGDCTVRQVSGGADDDSYIDVFELNLRQDATLDISMKSPTLDSVILLVDSDFRFIDIDDEGGEVDCDARLRRNMAAGNYLILTNTYTAETNCRPSGGKTEGAYEMVVSYETQTLPLLGREVSLLGGTSSASFSGGVTINGGQSYDNAVRPSDEFDVEGSIIIDPAHRNQPGFIVVVAILEDGQLLLKTEQGEFLAASAHPQGIPVVSRKTLGSTEPVDILSNISAAQFGVTETEIDFHIGYGLDSAPAEVYFHEEPISLVVRP